MKGFVVEFFNKEEDYNSTMCLSSYGYWTGKKYCFEKNKDDFFPFCTTGVEFGHNGTDGKTKMYKRKKVAVQEANELMKQVHDTICSYEVKKVSCRTTYQYRL